VACDFRHRIEFGPLKFLFQNFQISYHILLNFANFSGGGTFEKHADHEKKNRNRLQSNSQNLLKPFLKSRKKKNL